MNPRRRQRATIASMLFVEFEIASAMKRGRICDSSATDNAAARRSAGVEDRDRLLGVDLFAEVTDLLAVQEREDLGLPALRSRELGIQPGNRSGRVVVQV